LVTDGPTLLDGRYLLDGVIGAGGYCTVWRATDRVLTRPVAVKLLHAAYAYQPEARARLKAEAQHAGALAHENIARVYDYGEPELGQCYLVMELIEGPSLDSVLAGGPLDVARTMDIVAQVAAGLQAAHGAGLIHRDIKPANIMVPPEGTVRITDFGVAHSVGSVPVTATGTVVGSAAYIAPERVAGAPGGPASDLYALGLVAYECLAGSRPFNGPPLEVAIAHRDRPLPPPPAWVPAEVAAFVMTLTAKDPAWRPASAGEVASRARQLHDQVFSGAIGPRSATVNVPVTEGLGVIPSRARPGHPGRRLPPKTTVAVLAAVCGLALLTITGLMSMPSSHPASRPTQAAPTVSAPSPATAPTGTRPAGPQPSATPNATTRELAAGGPTPAGPPGHTKPAAPGPGPPSAKGHGHGHGGGN
jgi:serine/threonine-protein kinase